MIVQVRWPSSCLLKKKNDLIFSIFSIINSAVWYKEMFQCSAHRTRTQYHVVGLSKNVMLLLVFIDLTGRRNYLSRLNDRLLIYGNATFIAAESTRSKICLSLSHSRHYHFGRCGMHAWYASRFDTSFDHKLSHAYMLHCKSTYIVLYLVFGKTATYFRICFDVLLCVPQTMSCCNWWMFMRNRVAVYHKTYR